MGISKNRLFLEIPLQFLALWAAKRAFFRGKSLKTEVFKDSHIRVVQKLQFLNNYLLKMQNTQYFA
jgi:hypothetical protein